MHKQRHTFTHIDTHIQTKTRIAAHESQEHLGTLSQNHLLSVSQHHLLTLSLTMATRTCLQEHGNATKRMASQQERMARIERDIYLLEKRLRESQQREPPPPPPPPPAPSPPLPPARQQREPPPPPPPPPPPSPPPPSPPLPPAPAPADPRWVVLEGQTPLPLPIDWWQFRTEVRTLNPKPSV